MMAAGKRPVPFRTRKLSPPAPMVLPPGGSGRVGYRRPNNFTQAPAVSTRSQRVLCHIRPLVTHRDHPAGPRIADNHTTTHHWRTPTNYVTRLRIADNRGVSNRQGAYCGAEVEYRTSSTPACTDGLDLHYSTNNTPTTTRDRTTLRNADNKSTTHHWRTPMKTPGRHHPAGHDLSRGHISRGASTHSHDDADSRAKVEYRTSSTPAYTDELDLHHSTNNTPTKPLFRTTLRIADNHSTTHHWRPPTNCR